MGNETDEAYAHYLQIECQLRSNSFGNLCNLFKALPILMKEVAKDTILVGLIFLKLADFFCKCENEMRSHIIAALSKMESYSVLIRDNVDELVKRVSLVANKPDYLARQQMFYFLAYSAGASHKSPDTFYRIQEGLSSPNMGESEAALFAALKLAKFKLADCKRCFAEGCAGFLRAEYSSKIAKERARFILELFSECARTEDFSLYVLRKLNTPL